MDAVERALHEREARVVALITAVVSAAVTFILLGCEPAPPGDGGETEAVTDTGGASGGGSSPPPLDPSTIEGHAAECREALGRVPSFNCLEDGELIPITRDGVMIEDDAHAPGQRCDRPALLTEDCNPWARVGRLPGATLDGAPDPDVEWAFICRRYRLVSSVGDPRFQDVALIGHRRSTGATCFFQAYPDLESARVPAPGEPADETPPGAPTDEDFWLSPPETAYRECLRCHDADPWLHSPYVDQVRDPMTGGPLVPSGAERGAPYFVVGEAFSEWARPRHISPEGNRCVSCHRVGTRTCMTFAMQAVGKSLLPALSERSRVFPGSHWMPGEHGLDKQEWDATYLESVAQLIGCCAKPSRPGCNAADVPGA